MAALPSTVPSRLDALHTLLRARKLDRTLASETYPTPDAVAPFAHDGLSGRLRGGIPRGQLSEIHGPVSSGRTSLAWAALAAATARGEWVALVDTFDRFDPQRAADAGVDLSRLLWVRGQALSKTAGAIDPAWIPGERSVQGPGTLLERTIDRGIKALNLVAQSGVCTMVVLDLVDVPTHALARVPRSTWLRLHRIVEGTDTALLIVAAVPVARSAGGLSIATGAGVAPAAVQPEPVSRSPFVQEPSRARQPHTHVRWKGTHDRTRRLGGLSTSVRATSPRGFVSELPLALG